MFGNLNAMAGGRSAFGAERKLILDIGLLPVLPYPVIPRGGGE